MVAVIAVVLDHLLGWPSGGFVGVDVFFVISGFLITGLLLREHERTGTISFWGFYRRRIKRIIPVAVLVVVLTTLAAWFLFNQTRFWSTFWDGLFATLFAANWHLAAVGTDYFQAGTAVSPLQHYWSLSVEEQFYFVWPWLMLLIFVVTARLMKRSHQTGRIIAGTMMLAITAASFVWAMYETINSPTSAYFSTFSRTWELGVGALIAVFAGVLLKLPDRLRPMIAWLGLLGIGVSLFVITAESTFPAPWAALPVASTALVIVAGSGGQQRFLWPLTNPVSRYVGDISYSMYVWHWPIIVFGFALMDRTLTAVAIISALIVLASVFSYHLLEDPIRRSAWLEGRSAAGARKRSPRSPFSTVTLQQVMGVGLIAVIAVGLSGVAIVNGRGTGPSPAVAYVPPNAVASTAAASEPSTSPELDALHTELAGALVETAWPQLSPSMDDAMAARQAPDDVMACGFSKYEQDRCTFGDPAAPHTAFIVGNSISMTFVRPLQSAMSDSGWKVISYGMFGCPFADYSMAEVPADIEGCETRPDQAVGAINSLNPEIVFVIGARPADAAISQLRKITVSSRIVYVPPPPEGANVTECYSPTSSPADCVTGLDDGWDRYEQAISKSVPGEILPTSEWFCVEDRCPSFADSIPTKRDFSHMSIAYAERIVPVIRESLLEHGLIE
jgi:peptidoglycan/LPS O-acetylase OafA/YrhL